MNWLRAYLDRIKGRLTLAFAMSAAGLLLVWGVSTVTLDKYSNTVSGTVISLQDRLSAASQLEASLVDQLLAIREFELTGTPEALQQADTLGHNGATLRTRYIAIL